MTAPDAIRVIREAPDYVLGLLILSELGMSDAVIAARLETKERQLTELLATARAHSAWKTTEGKSQ